MDEQTEGFVSFVGRLTAFVGSTTMDDFEDGEVLGSRQLEMRCPIKESCQSASRE